MKKLMKKCGAAVVLAAFALMALGSGSEGNTTKDVVKDDVQNEAAADDAADGIVTEDDAGKADTGTITIEEQVLLDQDGIIVTAKEYTTDSIWGDGIKLLIENNTEQNVTVGCNALIVNDYMISDLFASDVAAGKKANETLYLSSSELEAAGIETIGQIEIYFHVFDSDSWDSLFDSDQVIIQTSAFEQMDIVPNDVGTELFNSDGIRIVGKTVDENTFWGSAILLYIENKTDKNIVVSCEDLSVNGFMLQPLLSSTVYAGKMSIDDITLFSNELEENGIESIDDVELSFHIYDADTFDTIHDTGAIAFSAK